MNGDRLFSPRRRDGSVSKAVFLSAFGFVLAAAAWGPGHDVVGDCVLRKLPDDWRARFREEWRGAFRSATHLPDCGDLKLLPASDLDWLRANCGLSDNAFVFHKPVAVFSCVDRLVHAMRAGDDRAVFVYLAVISHALADPAACNHDPIIHLPSYIWSPDALDVMPKTARALPVDFAFTQHDADTKARLAERLAALPFPAVPQDLTPARLYAEIARWETLAGAHCGRHSQAILDNGAKWMTTGDKTAALAASDALTELGFWGVRRTLYVFAAARMWAEKGGMVSVPPAEMKRIAAKQAADTTEIASRTVSDDSFARPYLAEPGRPSRVRVLYDTTAHMASSALAPINRPLGCQIVGSLKRIRPDLNASLMCLREFAKDGLDPAEAQVVVVFRGVTGDRGFDTRAFNARLKAYLDAGGKTIWIDGRPPAFVLGGAEKALSDGNRRDGYCKPAYPVSSLDVLLRSSFAWTGTGEKREWRWRRRPTGKAGWFWNGSRFVVDVSKLPPGAKPAAEIRSPEGVFTMAVQTTRAVYLPVCALFPYCLTEERPRLAPFYLALDSAGETVLRNVLDGFGLAAR